MPVFSIDPLRDPRWATLVERHPRASAFHLRGWLEALQRTYGYRPVALTTSAPGDDLNDGIVFCQIRSWLTGRRLVSLPFSDHCEPLVETTGELRVLLSAVEHEVRSGRWRYIEIRPAAMPGELRAHLQRGRIFRFHRLDLRPTVEELFGSFHKDCVQRKIRRAERERLTCEEGRSEALLRAFYQLLVLTRRRQNLPPQPIAWFRNLIACLGDKLTIRVASKDRRPVAAIITLSHKRTLVYKYGCSDKRFSNLGGMHLLVWRAILDAKRGGLVEMDMGRSDLDNQGLIEFKARWCAAESELEYLRYSTASTQSQVRPMGIRLASRLARVVPGGVLTAAGRVLYRHLG